MQNDLLSALLQLATKPTSFEQFAQEGLVLITQAVHAQASSVFEFNEQDQTLFVCAATGPVAEKMSDFLIPANTGIVGFVIQNKRLFVSDEAQQIKAHLKSISSILNYPFDSVVAVLLQVEEKIFGVLELMDEKKKHFSPKSVDLILEFATYFAALLKLKKQIS
jgi:signal transduction protein with GAF and PtsI domain